MWTYACRRLLLLPLTLLAILLVNFVIVNLAPGDPVSFTEVSAEGSASRREDRSISTNSQERYLQFREFYGLTLPILFNTWPSLSLEYVEKTLWQIESKRKHPSDQAEMPSKEVQDLRTLFGDQARFVMPHLLSILKDPSTSPAIKPLAASFFVRGGMRPGVVGPHLTSEQKIWNRHITQDDLILRSFLFTQETPKAEVEKKIEEMQKWFHQNTAFYHFEPDAQKKIALFFFETRFAKYFSRILHLDFGVLRNDPNRTVMSEVTRRFKYSLTLAILPMFITFGLCQIFGLIMACYQKRAPDYLLNLFFLILYAIPVFVVAPFLIEKVALYHCFPFTHSPIPISGFSSPSRIYDNELSYERLFDVLRHIAIPLVAVMYGSLAAQSRICRTAVLEVLSQDFVRTAKAKGLGPLTILIKHVGRNAGITVITSLAASLGAVLGGSLIVETLFDINGFGKFFYDAVINRDYNVIMFSAIAGSFLALMGYLIADLAYMWLDPRITLE